MSCEMDLHGTVQGVYGHMLLAEGCLWLQGPPRGCSMCRVGCGAFPNSLLASTTLPDTSAIFLQMKYGHRGQLIDEKFLVGHSMRNFLGISCRLIF